MPDFQSSGIRNLPHYTFHQCGFSLAVLSDKSHFLAAFYGQVHMVEHLMAAVGLAHVVANHRIVARARRRRELKIEL